MITHFIYHIPGRKVGCTSNIKTRKGWYPKDTVIEVIEELRDKTDQEAGDIEWQWADKFGYMCRKHYVDAISMGQSPGSVLTMSSDEVSNLNRQSAFKISSEERTERAKKAGAGSVRGLTQEQLLVRMRKANAGMTSEQRSIMGKDIGRKNVEFSRGIFGMSREQRSGISKNTGGFIKQDTCPHCGIKSNLPNLHRWHFDNCPHKLKPHLIRRAP